MNAFLKAALENEEELGAVMAQLHSHPELSFAEVETTKLIKEKLRALDMELIDLGMPTGAVAVLRGAKRGRAVGIRADIDAIVQEEASAAAAPSQTPGVMHACGHDCHTTCALGAAKILHGMRKQLPGDVVFVFQPAEEVTQGATEMFRHGLGEKLPKGMVGMFGLHAAGFEAGFVGAAPMVAAAGKTNFRITLHGKSGQGGFPHECVDVVVAGAAVVDGIQTIVSRNADPRKALVCAVYTVHAGKEEFFVTDKLVLSGSVRALDEETMRMAEGRVGEIARATAAAYQCTCEVEMLPQVPPLVNDAGLYGFARRAAEMIVGEEHVLRPEAMLGSDDFAVFGKHMPVFYFRLGVTAPGAPEAKLHHSDFCVDASALPIGSAVLAQAAALALGADWQR